MLEFALVLPILVILVFGFVELGRALMQTNMLTKAVTTGARFVARAHGVVGNNCQAGAGWSDAVGDASCLVSHGATGSGGTCPGEVLLPGLDEDGAIEFTIRPQTTGAVDTCVVRVEAEADFAAIFGDSVVPLLQLGPIRLNAQAEERFIGE